MAAMNEIDDEDSVDLFLSLYNTRETADEKFYFKEIIVSEQCLTFKYSYCNETFFESVLLLDMAVDPSDKSLMRTVFSIGMCVCSWYWMGYYTPEIVISQEVIDMCAITHSMMGFWEKLYHNVTLEYVYVNKLPYRKVKFVLAGGPSSDTVKARNATRTNNEHSIIIPMGGGKDSLVVWHEHKQAHPEQQPLLMYVADGLDEYAKSWRLQQLVKQTGDGLVLVRHDFQNELLHRVKRSYLKPCAHPWAALVLFDSLLVAQLTGIKEVTLGYERSADEGNGVYVENTVVLDTVDVDTDVGTPLSCTENPISIDNMRTPHANHSSAVCEKTNSGGTVVKVVKEEVNHQYDKSSFFLALAQDYIASFVDKEVKVVSTLHGLWELQIAKVFCRAPTLRPFLPVFLSCNEPTTTGDWCCRCDKCAFIFLLLSAWLPPQEVVHTVFGGVDMLRDGECCRSGSGNDSDSGGGDDGTCLDSKGDECGLVSNGSRKGLFMRLVGQQGSKPFDCVGTANEAAAAVHLTALRYSEHWEICSRGLVAAGAGAGTGTGADGNNTGTTAASIDGSRGAPPLLLDLCAYLNIELIGDNDTPAVADEDAILNRWGIV